MGFGLSLDSGLETGTTNSSDTFGNRRLASAEFFGILNVEVWTFPAGP